MDSPAGFHRVARALAQGRGPFAIDTERASAYRFDDRAFLVQIYRRGAGAFLLAPEGHRKHFTAALAPVINGEEWIIHAAGEDLQALAMMQLHPGTLFDTELAARFAGFTRPNLGAMVKHFTGVHLDKSHGRENWSKTPLPKAWLDYAALDVLYLHDLAEALAEVLDTAGVLPFAEAEFEHLIDTRSLESPVERNWLDLKGISTVRTARGLQLVRELFSIRERRAFGSDVSPSMIMPNQVLIAIGRAEPTTEVQLSRVRGFPSHDDAITRTWMSYVERALSDEEVTWPSPRERRAKVAPSPVKWKREYPESWARVQLAKEYIEEAATELGIPGVNLLSSSTLRGALWNQWEASGGQIQGLDTHALIPILVDAGARQWQAETAAPLVAAALHEPIEIPQA